MLVRNAIQLNGKTDEKLLAHSLQITFPHTFNTYGHGRRWEREKVLEMAHYYTNAKWHSQLTKIRIWISTRILWCDSMRTFYTPVVEGFLEKRLHFMIVSCEDIWQEQKGTLDSSSSNSRCMEQSWNPVGWGHWSVVPSHKKWPVFCQEGNTYWLFAWISSHYTQDPCYLSKDQWSKVLTAWVCILPPPLLICNLRTVRLFIRTCLSGMW